MIETLTKAKLEQYGFEKEDIERLTTVEDFELLFIGNGGYFFASNKENKIYSGEEGKQKHIDKSIFPEHHSEAKEKFETFEELFRYAVMADSITIPESNLGKQFDYKNAESTHNFSFNVWLQNFKGWEYGNEKTYIENLTRENWVTYLTICENEKQKHKEKAEKIKSNWTIKNLKRKSEMEFNALESCLSILDFYGNNDEKMSEVLLNPNIDWEEEYIEPFDKELNTNLLLKDTLEAKASLIKWYIFEFIEINFSFNIYREILKTEYDRECIDVNKAEKKLSTFEKVVIKSNQLFNILFGEIQLCCIKYDIDFFKLCMDLDFSIEFIDSGISLMFEEKRNRIALTQQAETKIPNSLNRSIAAEIAEKLRTEVEMDELFLRAEKIRKEKGVVNSARQKNETKTEQRTPKTFEELFYKPEHAEPCLKILSELQPPVIDAINNYIGKAKGVFPLWVNVLKNHKPEPLIRHFKDTVYKDLLNQKVKGLNLSKDASEFRKQYVRLINDKTELDIKTILSQYSQSGKLGK